MMEIPYAVFEGTQIRHERTVKRLIIALIIAGLLVFASNAIWLYAWCQYDYESTETKVEYSQDGQGLNNINTGSQGDINGAKVDDNDKNKETP